MIWSQLPAVVLVKVLGYLPLSDQLSARRVCKHWQMVNDSFVSRRELILFIKIHPRSVCWQYDQQEADLSNGLMVNYQFLESEFFSIYFRKIQRLMVAFSVNTPCKQLIEPIQASFIDLQHLQLTSTGLWDQFFLRKALQSELHLENLRTFYAQAADVPLNLNCPKLTELFVISDLTIDETMNEQTKKCLQNLKLLKVNRLANPAGFEFSQLEVLHIMNSQISLVDFPLLKELHCEMMKEVLAEELLQQKERLKRDHLRIYFRGFGLEGRTFSKFFEQIGFYLGAEGLRLAKESSSSCNFSLERKTLHLSDSSDDEFAGLKEGDLPEGLFRSIMDVTIEGLSKVSPAFFEICYRFPYVQSIFIRDEVGQALLDRLPDLLPHLVAFRYGASFFLGRPALLRDQLISFEFVARFKSLNFFSACNRHISIDEFQLILQNCKVLWKVFFFRSEPKSERFGLWIERTGKPEERIYELDWSKIIFGNIRDFARTSFDHEELLNYLEASRWMQKVDFLKR